ncbi:hypothetical protein CCAX7_20570 [Capsulimonas corticalis]|uniref:Uncharacterized protein n=1 Tax=Capsulimonas corticalis TaxID=2219043 RepID=A0A402D2B2_9BACT|nr:hypothetical protein [Capsulimonas corticalis]BDI30006.1 hypothetical protein CCAX7_20570 [Capsulimonas corticalis]
MTENLVTTREEIIVYPDKKKIICRLNARAVFIMLPVALGLFALFGFLRGLLRTPIPPFINAEFAVLPWLVLGFYVFAYVAALANVRRQNQPIVTISAEGLMIYTLATQLGLVRWDEIANVTTYNMIYRYVGIIPRDTAGLCRRLGAVSWLIRMNSWCVPLYRLIGVPLAPINIPQEYLPISADELAQRIRSYRAGMTAPSVGHDETGVWPPPPSGQIFWS